MSRIDELVEQLCPDGVEYRALGKVTRVVRGKRVVRKNLDSEKGFPVYQNSLKPLGYYSESNRSGGTTFVICAGAAGDVGYSSEDFWSADDCFCPESNTTLDGRYLYHVILSMQPRLKAQVRKASIPRLSPKAIETLRIPVPPMEIQQEIVRVLDSFTELEADLEAELEARQCQFCYCRRNSFKSSDADSVQWLKLGDVIRFVNGRAYKKDELLPQGKYRVLRVGNFFTNDSWYYSDLDLPNDKYCNDEDLLYAWSASFGPRIWHGEKTIFHYHIWRLEFDETILDKRYLYHFLGYDVEFIRNSPSTTKSTMMHVSMTSMKERIIPVPPIEQQVRVANALDQFDALINNISQGLPAEIEARRKQYAYYRDKLLSFKEKVS